MQINRNHKNCIIPAPPKIKHMKIIKAIDSSQQKKTETKVKGENHDWNYRIIYKDF